MNLIQIFFLLFLRFCSVYSRKKELLHDIDYLKKNWLLVADKIVCTFLTDFFLDKRIKNFTLSSVKGASILIELLHENLPVNQIDPVRATASVIYVLQTVSRKLWSTRLIFLRLADVGSAKVARLFCSLLARVFVINDATHPINHFIIDCKY